MRPITMALLGLALGKSSYEREFDVAIPVVRSATDLAEAEARIDRAEWEVMNGNRTSRIVLVAGVVTIFASIFASGEGDFSCRACQKGIAAAARVSRLPGTRSMVLLVLKKMCERIGGKSSAVCQGVAESNGNVLYDVLNEMDLDNNHVRQVACFAVGNACPMPEVPARPQWFPIAHTKVFPKPRATSFKYILQLSDLHYDPEYTVGAEADCSRPLCCQPDSNDDDPHPTAIKRPAGRWGDFRCDLNRAMLRSLLAAARRVGQKTPFDMVIFTGDVPPHDMWKENLYRGKRTATTAFNALHDSLGKYPIYPVVGNHESVPINQFPLDGRASIYPFLADRWRQWLPESALASVRRGGYYAHTHNGKLRVITLNNNLCYTYNFQLLLDPANPDPNGILQWLTDELQRAEDAGMRAIILGHVPPGSKECYQHWSDRHYAIIRRYHATISAQFYGHEHFDEFQLFYSSDTKAPATAIAHAFVAPSMTPFDGHNPGFRVYKVDAQTYHPVDYTQYYADMTAPGAWNATRVAWKALYSARATYGRQILKNRPNATALLPPFWHRVTEMLAKNDRLFQTFYQLRTKNSHLQPPCSDAACRARFVCALRAGKSRDNCHVPVPFT